MGGTRVLIFDAIFTGAEVVNESDEYCSSLAYVLNPDRPNVLAGVYDIYAKVVRVFSMHFPVLKSLQVVTFRHDVHMSSPARTTNDFDLMGLILEVCRFHCSILSLPCNLTTHLTGNTCTGVGHAFNCHPISCARYCIRICLRRSTRHFRFYFGSTSKSGRCFSPRQLESARSDGYDCFSIFAVWCSNSSSSRCHFDHVGPNCRVPIRCFGYSC